MSPGDIAMLTAALAREPTASRALVQRLTPSIQARVHAVLLRAERAGRLTVTRERVVDYTQEVFLTLLEDEAKVLRSWSPDRGANLSTFVGLVAERVALALLRSGRRGAWLEDPTLSEGIDLVAEPAEPATAPVENRDYLRKLLDALKESLSPRGMELFRALYVEQRSIEDVAAAYEMTPEALYAWRSRLKRLLVELDDKLLRERVVPFRRPASGVDS